MAVVRQSFEKSLYRHGPARHFYGTEIEIWAGFWAVGSTIEKNGPTTQL